MRLLLALFLAAPFAAAEFEPLEPLDRHETETVGEAVRYYILAAEEKKPWDVVAALGLSVTDNGRNTSLTFNAEAVKEWGTKHKLTLNLRSTYQDNDGDLGANEHIFVERYDYKLDEKSSVYQRLFLEYDEVEGVDLRIILTFGYSRKLIQKKKFELEADAGLGWRHDDKTIGTTDDLVGDFGILYKWKITDALHYTQRILYSPKLTDTPEFILLAEAIFSTPISKQFDAALIIRDQYTSDTVGAPPNDFKIALTIAFRSNPKKKE